MASRVDRFRPADISALDSPDRYDELVSVIRLADDDGIVTPLPTSADEVHTEDIVPSRINTIRTRLFLLGYLGKDNASPVIDARLRKAIRDFQREAELTVDAWVGDETWSALAELVDFETWSDVSRWFVRGKPNPALLRATDLRLHVLGLLDARHPRKRDKVDRALGRFVMLADLLGLSDERLPSHISPSTLRVLFDQDRLSARLAQADEQLVLREPRGMRKHDARRLAHRFVVCVARIELWLLGFEVELGRKPRFETPDRPTYRVGRFRLYHALRTFWRESGQSDADAARSAETISAAFFRQLEQTQREGDRAGDRDGVDELYRTLTEAPRKEQRVVWRRFKSIGSRIWDGIKRTWRWFKALVKRGVRAGLEWARNLARLAYRHAAAVFAAVRDAVSTGIDAVAFVSKKVVPGSDPLHLVICHDADFDYDLFVNRAHDPAKVEALLQEFSAQSLRFVVVLSVLGLLLEALVDTMRRSALGGWFGFVLSLIKIQGSLRALGRLLLTYDASPA